METGFPALRDLQAQYSIILDYCRLFFPIVPYYCNVTSRSEVNTLYGETVEHEKEFSGPIDLRAHVIPAAQTFPLTKFGSEEVRDVDLQVSVPNLVEVGLATQDADTFQVTLVAKPGDRFLHSGRTYEVLWIRIGRVFGNTDIPTWFQFHAEKVREDSLAYQRL